MIQKVVRIPEEDSEEAQRQYQEHEELVSKLHKEAGLTGRPGEAGILRLAIKLGLPQIPGYLALIQY